MGAGGAEWRCKAGAQAGKGVPSGGELEAHEQEGVPLGGTERGGCITVAGAEEAWARATAGLAPEGTSAQLQEPVYRVKPLLTPENLNRFYQANWRRSDFAKLAEEAKRDPEKFLSRYFTLTREQQAYLRSRFTAQERAKLGAFIDAVVQRTEQHKKMNAAGSPGAITPIGGAHSCPEGSKPECLTLKLLITEVEYCWCE